MQQIGESWTSLHHYRFLLFQWLTYKCRQIYEFLCDSDLGAIKYEAGSCRITNDLDIFSILFWQQLYIKFKFRSRMHLNTIVERLKM